MAENHYQQSALTAFRRAGFMLDDDAGEQSRLKRIRSQHLAANDDGEPRRGRKRQDDFILYGRCGRKVWDLGDEIAMHSDRGAPMRDEQIVALVQRALQKGWGELFIYKAGSGKPDLELAHRVNRIIEQMGCQDRIKCCTNPDELKTLWEKKAELAAEDEAQAAPEGDTGFHRPRGNLRSQAPA